MADGQVTFLHTNDLHGRLDGSSLPFLLDLRERVDLYVDSGDGVKAGNLGVPLGPEAYWACLRQARCTVSTLGNRESHVLRTAFAAKTAGMAHPVVVANMTGRDGTPVFPASHIVGVRGQRIGFVGTMVAMVTARMATAAASQYLWTDPVEAALAEADRIRGDVDLLVLVSHVGHRTDVRLAETGAFDIVFGGHSHTVLAQPERLGRTWVCQGGSHARYAGVYTWDFAGGTLTGGLHPWLAR